MDNESIKKNIMMLRLERDLSQIKMAEALGISRNSYRNVEKGKTRMISDTVLKVAEWAGLTPEEVVLGYKPSEAGSAMLKDAREQFNNRVKNLTDEYEEKLAVLRNENGMLKERIKDLEGYVQTLKSMTALLQKGREEDKND